MIGIIGAMNQEIAYLVNKMEVNNTVILASRRFYVGTLNERDVVVVKAGIGKVNAAMTTTLLLERFDIDYVINAGIAGGLTPAKQEELIICDGACYHDVDVIGNLYGQIEDMPIVFPTSIELTKKAFYVAKKTNTSFCRGIIASGDQFITDSSKLQNIRKNVEEIIAVEMEGTAIAQVCYTYNKPFIIIRMVSDVLDTNTQLKTYDEIKDSVCLETAKFVVAFIK